MSVKTAQRSETITNSTTLTTLEQGILNMLLADSIPKEIAETFNIGYETVLEHKRNIYRKLDVRNINELLSKYYAGSFAGSSAEGLTEKNKVSVQEINVSKAVFKRWDIFHDTFGSNINVTSSIELIKNNYFEIYNISGNKSYGRSAFVVVIAFPDLSTHETMKKMERFSFTVLGDGKTYAVILPTTEARLEGESNNYGKVFTAENGIISTHSFNINELVQSPFFGKKVPFVQENIEAFQIQVHSDGNFNLKIWDINFY